MPIPVEMNCKPSLYNQSFTRYWILADLAIFYKNSALKSYAHDLGRDNPTQNDQIWLQICEVVTDP